MTELEYKDLPEKVYGVIREMILRGDFDAGQKLVQEDLAERLGVSRTPILSALTKLEKELLVEIIPRRGAFVRKLSLDQLKDIYDIRIRLEPLGAFNAALRADPDGLNELKETLDSFHAVAEAHDQKGIFELDYRYHMAIHRLSGNELLYRMISSYSLVVLSNITRFMRDPVFSYKDHAAVYKAIAAGEAARAEEHMRLHLEASRALLEKVEEL
jgi:DNA-binding GntR family transcriptional regulator